MRTCTSVFPFSLFLRFETCDSMHITNKRTFSFLHSSHLLFPLYSHNPGSVSQCLCQSLRCCHQCSSASLSVCYCVRYCVYIGNDKEILYLWTIKISLRILSLFTKCSLLSNLDGLIGMNYNSVLPKLKER